MAIVSDPPLPAASLAPRAEVELPREARARRGRRVRVPPAWLVLGVVGVAALAWRLAFLLRAPVFIIGDSENYFWPGYQLARGIGFDLDIRRTPIYPAFIALVVTRIGEDLAALALAQHLLGVLTSLLVAWLGLRLYGPWTALLGGLLAAVAAPLLVAEHYVMAEALFIPLAAVAIVWLCRSIERLGAWRMLVGGLLIGVAGLTRPVGLVLAVALGVALLVQERSVRRAIVRGLPALLGVALLFVPWMLRNAATHGSFSADGNGGQTLVGRAMRHDRGFAFSNPDDPDSARQRARAIMREGRGQFVSPVRERIKRELGLDDRAANTLMRDLALETILRQPGHFVWGTAQNFLRLAAGIPDRSRDHWATRREERNREEWEALFDIRHLLGPPTAIQEQQFSEANALVNLYQPSRLGLVLPLLALVGSVALVARGRGGVGVFLGLTAFGLLLAGVTLVAPLPRYRYPAEPLLGLLAAGGLAWLAGLAIRGVARATGRTTADRSA